MVPSFQPNIARVPLNIYIHTPKNVLELPVHHFFVIGDDATMSAARKKDGRRDRQVKCNGR